MKNKLRQKAWFREWFPGTTYFKSRDGEWDLLQNRLPLEPAADIANGKGSMTWCDNTKCGNELVHTDSFITERTLTRFWPNPYPVKSYVYDYECSCCGLKQYRRPDLGPGLRACDEKGVPHFLTEVDEDLTPKKAPNVQK